MDSRVLPCLLALGCLGGPPIPGGPDVPVVASGACAESRIETVACVIDGDTVDLGGCRADRAERVRLLGIDAPEVASSGGASECWAETATFALHGLLRGREAILSFDRECVDTYGRTLAYLWLPDDDPSSEEEPLLVNEWLLAEGHARIYDGPASAPLALEDRLVAAEADARARGIGLWTGCAGGGS